jgi:hypothetical protein
LHDVAHAATLAERLRSLVQVDAASIFLDVWSLGQRQGAIASGLGTETDCAQSLQAWLGSEGTARTLPVPPALHRRFAAFQVLVVPIASPFEHYGVAAVSVAGEAHGLLPRVENVVTDFALLLEEFRRRALMAQLKQTMSSNPQFAEAMREESPARSGERLVEHAVRALASRAAG